MPDDLEPADVEAFTGGRLPADEDETARVLNSALSRARRHCNWHVSPLRTETVVLRGTGAAFLPLPTLKVQEIVSVKEGGVDLDLDAVRLDGIMLRKNGPWHGTVEVELTHGYPADEVADFREAVLMMVDQATMNTGARGEGVTGVKVDDVEVKWSESGLSPEIAERLAPYRRLAWVAA